MTLNYTLMLKVKNNFKLNQGGSCITPHCTSQFSRFFKINCNEL